MLIASLSLILNIWKSNHGLIMHDDAWYCFLLRDMPNASVTQYYKFWGNFFQGNIIWMKLLVVVCDIIGALFFAGGLYSLWKRNDIRTNSLEFWALTALVYMSVSLFSVLLTAMSYVTMNRFLVQIGMGSMMIALANNKVIYKFIFTVIAGFVLSLLTFVMFTNMLIIPVCLFVFVFLESSKRNRILISIGFLLGIIIGLSYYFGMVEDISSFLFNLKENANKALNDSIPNHGIKAILLWVYQSIFSFYISTLFIYVLAIYGLGFLWRRYNDKWFRLILFLLLLSFLWYYFRMHIWRKGYSVAAVTPFYIMYIYLCCSRLKCLTIKQLMLILLCFFTPFFLSIGTDTNLSFRSHEYMCFLLPVIYVLVRGNRRELLVFLCMISLYFITTTLKLDKSNWGHMVYTEQKYNVNTLGLSQHIYVNKEQYVALQEMQNLICANDRLVISHPLLWGYVYLMDVEPLVFDYMQSSDNILKALDEHENISLKCLEGKWYPFDEGLLEDICLKLNKDSICCEKIGVGKIYSFK